METSNWYDGYLKYDSTKGEYTDKFDINIEDLQKWAQIYGDDATKQNASKWNIKDARSVWRDKNSGIQTAFNNFINWVKNNGGYDNFQNDSKTVHGTKDGDLYYNNASAIKNDKLKTSIEGPNRIRSWEFYQPKQEVQTQQEQFPLQKEDRPWTPLNYHYTRADIRNNILSIGKNPYDVPVSIRTMWRRIGNGDLNSRTIKTFLKQSRQPKLSRNNRKLIADAYNKGTLDQLDLNSMGISQDVLNNIVSGINQYRYNLQDVQHQRMNNFKPNVESSSNQTKIPSWLQTATDGAINNNIKPDATSYFIPDVFSNLNKNTINI